MSRFLGSLAAAAFSVATLLPAVATANGRFPTANQLVIDPSNPSRIVVRATIGVLISTDSGGTWSWICESAYSKTVLTDDPAIGVTADGSILVGGSNGMARSHEGGCAFTEPTGSLVGKTVVDLAVEPTNRAHVYAVYGVLPDGGAINDPPIGGGVARSMDDGATWSDVGSIIDDFTPLTIDVAPSNPNVLYASGHDAAAAKQLLFRSDDAGTTWKRIVIPGPGNVYIAAIDSTSPDKIFVRTDDVRSRLMVSDDAGATFHEILAADDLLVGFALSPDGKQIAAGSSMGGVFLLTPSDGEAGAWTSEKIRDFNVVCLTWGAAGLYACSDEQRDGYAIGLAKDARQPFTPLLRMPTLTPLVCPSEPGRCASDWCSVAPTIGVDAGCPAESAPDAAGGDDALDGAPTESIEGAVTSPAPVSSGGCGCRQAVDRGSEGSTWSALLCAIVVAWRNRKRTSKTMAEPI
jgi:photosystem II stability/assembly factor-like uncharacterized protein